MASRQEYKIVGTKGRIIVPRAFRTDLYGGKGQFIAQIEKVDRKEKWATDLYKLVIEQFSQAVLAKTETAYTLDGICG